MIDPVISHLGQYLRLLDELQLDLKAVLMSDLRNHDMAVLTQLQAETGCDVWLAQPETFDGPDKELEDGGLVMVGALDISVVHTPGHTQDSFSFHVDAGGQGLIFTGNTLLIRGCGRTDLPSSDAGQLFDSLHEKLLFLPNETIVCPGSDDKGWTVSSIGEEKQHNPCLQITDRQAFIDFRHDLDKTQSSCIDIESPASSDGGKPH